MRHSTHCALALIVFSTLTAHPSLGGELGKAVDLIREAAEAAPTPADRFRGKLAVAQLCLGAGQHAIARSQLEGLTQMITDHDLASWDPRVCAEVYAALYTAFFYDVGTVGLLPFDLGEFGHGVGIGMRYYTSVGPVRVDFAYNPGELFAMTDRYAIHLAFGFSF